jgi:hypothetical protein
MQHLLRKQIKLIGILMISSLSLNAQKNEVFQPNHDEMPYYLGISIGLGVNHLNSERNIFFNTTAANFANQLNLTNSKNINLGLTGTLKLSEHFLLRANPMLLIGGSKSFGFMVNSVTDTIDIPSTIITLPLALKMQSNRYNAFGYKSIMRHYVFGGGKADFDLSSSKQVNSYKGVPYKALLNGTDLGYEFGLGLSFYLRYVTISPEIKFSYGLTNLKNNKTTEALLNNINKVNANFIYFTIHLEN